MKRLLKYFKGYGVQALFGPTLKLLETVLELLMPIAVSVMINNLYNEPTVVAGVVLNFSTRSCIIFLSIIVFFNYACAVTCQRCAAVSAMGFGANLRRAMYAHINSMSYTELDAMGTATCINRITNDVNVLQNGVAKFFRLVFRLPVLVVGSLVFTFLINIQIGVIFTCTLPVVVLILFLVMRNTIKGYAKAQSKLDAITAATRENIEGARVIRAFARGDDELEDEKKRNGAFRSVMTKLNNISALLSPLSSFIINVGIAVIIVISGKQVDGGLLSKGEISAFVTYSLWLLTALTVFANLSVEFTRAFAAKDRINELLELGNSEESGGNDMITPCEEILRFDNVCFEFANSKEVLHNISFSVKKGEYVGVIGGTGSGKSTMLSLIPRFYKATSGEVLFDGENVNSYNVEALRASIGIVPQKAVLFSGTIEENIAWGLDNYDKSRVAECAKLAQADEFISKLKDGYNSRVEAGGRNFSGGQIQRLTIARALMRDPRLLIMDDSSSALDYATDARLRIALRKLCKEKGMTVIVVSQRAGTIRHADKIIVMDGGRICDMGTHAELSAKDGIYRDVCLTQFKEESL